MTLDCDETDIHLSKSNGTVPMNERSLEECWSTIQRLFIQKNAIHQMQRLPTRPTNAYCETDREIDSVPRICNQQLTNNTPNGSSACGEQKSHQCQQCLKTFSSNHQLVQHIRVHTGEKPYKCSYCDRRFKQLSHVQQHTRLHTGERPYKCHLPECGRAFIQLSNLQQHLRNHDAQVERAKNRPFHCNICGKGFATESSLRTHTSKELQLHLGVLQQHAALIGGSNATTCPVCCKFFLGAEALMEHMRTAHNSNKMSDNAKESTILENNERNENDIKDFEGNSISVALRSSSSMNETYLSKRKIPNHPCPICGKQYVNEGSLRKHLACHSETSQMSNLRMWPCSVCQAVFTNESGLLGHMDHMRMDPKHQFAAQYVLSRAAAERREEENAITTANKNETSVENNNNNNDMSNLNGFTSPLMPSNNLSENEKTKINIDDFHERISNSMITLKQSTEEDEIHQQHINNNNTTQTHMSPTSLLPFPKHQKFSSPSTIDYCLNSSHIGL